MYGIFENIGTYKYMAEDNCMTTFISKYVDFRETKPYLIIC